MASTKREPPSSYEHEAKKAKVYEPEPYEPPKQDELVLLNPADCNLDFNVEGNGLQGSALHEQGFAYCWSGSRANVGIKGGKYCFGCKIISAQPVEMEDTPPDQQHVCRVGISRGDDPVGNLGETEHSFGFGGTAKFSHAGKFSDYGEKYGVGDIILCAVNLENKPMAFIGFSKNGKWLGTSKHFNAGPTGLGVVDSPVKKLQWESAIFPHILLKNVVVQLQFSIEDGLVPEGGYKPWASAIEDGNAIMGPTFSNPQDCEVMMMVGLPASGKTTWAEKWVKDHPEKRYVLLGTNLALDQMKVPGLLRKQNYGERFDRLMDRATGIFNTLLSRASRTPRNFVIDQTNVYKSARKRKLKPFANYRKIAVVVVPKPEDLKIRADKRFKEMGKDVPAEAVNEMLANFVLPMSRDMHRADEYFDQVIFVELNRAESQRHLEEMKANLNSKSDLPPYSPYSRGRSIQSYGSPSMQHSRESSVRSYNSSLQQNQGTLPVASASGHWGSSYPHQPPLRTSYGDHYSISIGYLPGDDLKHYGYGGRDQSRRNDIGYGIASSERVADLSPTYGVDDHSHPNFSTRNFTPGGATDPYSSGVVESYGRTTPFAYNTHGGHASVPGGPQTDISAPIQSRRNDMGYRMASYDRVADPSPTYRVDDHSHPNFSSRNFTPRGATDPYPSGLIESYGRTTPFASNTHGGHASVPGGPLTDISTPRQFTYMPGPPTTYVSYRTPVPRSPYGNYPSSMQHPRSGFY